MSMFTNLAPGAIGIRADLEGTIRLATQDGWQGIDLPIVEVAQRVNEQSFDVVRSLIAQGGLQLGGWGLPFDWQAGADQQVLEQLQRYAALSQRLGCTRVYTWVRPFSDELAFHENWARHVALLRPIAQTLAAQGCQLGLEFIGPRHLREDKRYGFIYSLEGMLTLAEALGDNVGLLLDCYHWYTSMGTIADIRALRASDVVYVHVNDAPSDVPVEAQQDLVRRLPTATGVIDITGFLGALQEIGYAGPLTPEPFDQQLTLLPPDAASRMAADYMRRLW